MVYDFGQVWPGNELRWQTIIPRSLAVRLHPLKPLSRDPVLLIAFLIAGLIELYQLTITLLQPPWAAIVTDWLRAVLAYPELGVVVFVSWWFTRTRRPGVLSWWMLSMALLSYIIARSLWSLEDLFVYPGHVPFPSFPDLFFVLQYPFFFLAVILMPRLRPWGPRIKAILDCLLWMGAATALTWYFILDPIFRSSGESALGKCVNLAYPIGDLAVLFGLLMALTRQNLRRPESAALRLLILAVVSLTLADVWVAAFLLYFSPVYKTGNPPDLFWISFYMLVPLAALVQLRLPQHGPSEHQARPTGTATSQSTERRQDLIESFRVLLPSLTALLASFIIVICAVLVPVRFKNPLVPCLVAFGLLVLVLARHMKLCLQLGIRRGQHLIQRCGEAADQFKPFMEHLSRAERQVAQLDRLVSDLLDVSRIRADRLELRREWTDLVAVVSEAVEEQRLLTPNRVMSLHLPPEPRLHIYADPGRIGQVVTNYLTNALKYSAEDCPVIIGLEVGCEQARVWVRDEGPGLSVEEQARIWERFHRVSGIEVQSGTGVGLGLGLHICQTIIERHEGQVGVESAPGKGSTFWFTLPLAPPPADMAAKPGSG